MLSSVDRNSAVGWLPQRTSCHRALGSPNVAPSPFALRKGRLLAQSWGRRGLDVAQKNSPGGPLLGLAPDYQFPPGIVGLHCGIVFPDPDNAQSYRLTTQRNFRQIRPTLPLLTGADSLAKFPIRLNKLYRLFRFCGQCASVSHRIRHAPSGMMPSSLPCCRVSRVPQRGRVLPRRMGGDPGALAEHRKDIK